MTRHYLTLKLREIWNWGKKQSVEYERSYKARYTTHPMGETRLGTIQPSEPTSRPQAGLTWEGPRKFQQPHRPPSLPPITPLQPQCHNMAARSALRGSELSRPPQSLRLGFKFSFHEFFVFPFWASDSPLIKWRVRLNDH